MIFCSSFEECNGVDSPRKMMLNKQRQAMIEGIGPLQIIYKLPHDEVLSSTNYNAICRRAVSYTDQNLINLNYLLSLQIAHQSYSCALERCFLLHGRMYISQWHLCFHSNVFSKQLNVSKYFENGSWNLI